MAYRSPEQFFERTLFPKKEEHLMYFENTFRFFQRVLTEMEEAKKSVEHYQALAQQHEFDQWHDENWNLLTTVEAQIQQMKKASPRRDDLSMSFEQAQRPILFRGFCGFPGD